MAIDSKADFFGRERFASFVALCGHDVNQGAFPMTYRQQTERFYRVRCLRLRRRDRSGHDLIFPSRFWTLSPGGRSTGRFHAFAQNDFSEVRTARSGDAADRKIPHIRSINHKLETSPGDDALTGCVHPAFSPAALKWSPCPSPDVPLPESPPMQRRLSFALLLLACCTSSARPGFGTGAAPIQPQHLHQTRSRRSRSRSAMSRP